MTMTRQRSLAGRLRGILLAEVVVGASLAKREIGVDGFLHELRGRVVRKGTEYLLKSEKSKAQ